MTSTENSKLDTVRKLLNQAERAGTPEEAEAFAAKAERLMIAYGIDAAALAAANPEAADKIGERTIRVQGYTGPKTALLSGIARALNCDVVVHSFKHMRGVKVVTAYGFERDLEAFDVLSTSLLLQVVTGAGQAHAGQPWTNGRTFRHNYMLGFTHRVYDRMMRARETAVAETSTSTALALVDRSQKVKAHIDELYPELGKPRGTKVTDPASYLAGDQAGQRARLDGPGGTTAVASDTDRPMLHN